MLDMCVLALGAKPTVDPQLQNSRCSMHGAFAYILGKCRRIFLSISLYHTIGLHSCIILSLYHSFVVTFLRIALHRCMILSLYHSIMIWCVHRILTSLYPGILISLYHSIIVSLWNWSQAKKKKKYVFFFMEKIWKTYEWHFWWFMIF